jgi:hypothetical protein
VFGFRVGPDTRDRLRRRNIVVRFEGRENFQAELFGEVLKFFFACEATTHGSISNYFCMLKIEVFSWTATE